MAPTEDPLVVETTAAYDASATKFDIVTIHGIHRPQDPLSSKTPYPWLRDVLDSTRKSARIIHFDYDTGDATRWVYADKVIRDEASSLLQKLAALRQEGSPDELRPLAFVAHDIGGIIVKEALALASRRTSQFSHIRSATRLLVFLGCPHRCTSVEDMENSMTRLLFLAENHTVGISQAARRIAQSVIAANRAFLQTNLLARATVVNMFSTKANLNEQVFSMFTATLGITFEMRLGLDQTYDDMVRNLGKLPYAAKKASAWMDRVASFPWLNSEVSPLIDLVESRASPVYPQRTSFGTKHQLDWLDENQHFRQWLDGQGPRILHIHGSTACSDAAEYAFQKRDRKRGETYGPDVVLYFKFHRHDIRRNSIGAMSNSFLAQIFSRHRSSPAGLVATEFGLPEFHSRECWTDKDAFFFLKQVRVDLGSAGQVCWILDCMDQCDQSSSWFLSEIVDIAAHSEVHFQVLVTTLDGRAIQDILGKHPAIDLASHTDGNAALAVCASQLVDGLLQDKPRLRRFEPEARRLSASCGTDEHLVRLLLAWFRAAPPFQEGGRDVEEELRALSPPTPRKLFERALGSIAPERRPRAQRVIQWVMLAARPLTPGELGAALSLGEGGSVSEQSTADVAAAGNPDIAAFEVCDVFGPLLAVDDNGEVHFAHPVARDIFLPPAGPQEGSQGPSQEPSYSWYTIGNPEESHRRISEVCLACLAIPEVRKRLAASPPAVGSSGCPPHPALNGANDLASYAIQYWPWHFQRGYVGSSSGYGEIEENATAFLSDHEACKDWAAVHGQYSKLCRARNVGAPPGPLPLLSALGMGKMVLELVGGRNASWEDDDGQVAAALVEAARHNQGHLVPVLLGGGLRGDNMSTAALLDAMESSASAGNFALLEQLVAHVVATTTQEIQWPAWLLSRVAWSGLEKLVLALIKAKATIEPSPSLDVPPPLYCGAVRNHVGVVKALLDSGANHTVPYAGRKGRTALHEAARLGHAAVVRELATRGAALDENDEGGGGFPPLYWAALLAQHKVIEELVKAGVSKYGINKGRNRQILVSCASRAFLRSLAAILPLKCDFDIAAGPQSRLPLSVAAESGHIDICRLLIDNGANVNGVSGDRPLISAAQSGRLEAAELLIDRGADLNVTSSDKSTASTPLTTACSGGFEDMVSMLIRRGANVDLAPGGKTALFEATSRGHADIARVLAAAGADQTITVAGSQRWRPVHAAYRNPECARAMMDCGVDIDVQSRYGSLLHLASIHGYVDTVRLLISRRAKLDVKLSSPGVWGDGFDALLMAAGRGHTGIVAALLEAGTDVKVRAANSGDFAVHVAMGAPTEACLGSLEALLQYNLDVNARNGAGETALHKIQSSTPVSAVRLLARRGASVNIRDDVGRTPLSRAVACGNADVAKYLIESGADVNDTGGYLNGPLFVACHAANIDMLKLLVEHGADVNVCDPALSGTPLMAACRGYRNENQAKRAKVIRYLIEEAGADVCSHGGLFGSALNMACLYLSPEIIKLILAGQGATNVDLADLVGRRPVHLATLRTMDHLQPLLDLCPDMSVKDKLGRTSLHTAVGSGRTDVVERVLSRVNKGSINEPDMDGWTPLFWAVRSCCLSDCPPGGQASVVKLLLDSGADMWATTSTLGTAWSPLKVARYHGASRAVRKMLMPRRGHETGPSGRRQEEWDRAFHKSNRAKKKASGACYICIYDVYGREYRCKSCNIVLCFKCYPRRNELHPGHQVHPEGEEEFVDCSEDEDEEAPEERGPGVRPAGVIEVHEEEGEWSDDEGAK
ncbi:hypothetical protein RB598_005240 [Gaeumannomyces tritici]